MEITWLGHSCFRLRTAGAILITDPYPPTLGVTLGNVQARLVTVSNEHPNHCHVEGVRGSPTVIQGPGEYEVAQVYIKAIRTGGKGAPPNNVFVIDMDGLTLCHLGDLAEPLSARQVEQLSGAHVLFVPVGHGCTLSVAQAVECITLIEPKVVIPMHYGQPDVKVELEPLDVFVKEMGLKDVQPQPRLSLTSSNVPNETRVIVLERAAA